MIQVLGIDLKSVSFDVVHLLRSPMYLFDLVCLVTVAKSNVPLVSTNY